MERLAIAAAVFIMAAGASVGYFTTPTNGLTSVSKQTVKKYYDRITPAVTVVAQAEPEVYYLNPVLAIAIARQWVRDQKAIRMAVPCKKAGRIRSPKDEQCWLPGRMP